MHFYFVWTLGIDSTLKILLAVKSMASKFPKVPKNIQLMEQYDKLNLWGMHTQKNTFHLLWSLCIYNRVPTPKGENN